MRVLRLQHRAGDPSLLNVSFPYDPELVDLIKRVPGRQWDKAQRVWLIPATPENLAFLRERTPPLGVKLVADAQVTRALDGQQAAIEQARAIRERGDARVEYDFVTPPYAHQRAGFAFLQQLGSGALLWEMGLGKTKTAIDYAEWCAQGEWARAFRVLVICPNTIKRNWAAEVVKHADHADYVIPDGTLAQRAKMFGAARYTIVNCEQLSYATTAKALIAREWDMVIVDESTRFKTPNAARTKVLHKIKAPRRLILTGTPITNVAEDAWAQYHFIAPGLLGSWWGFRDRYLELDYFRRPIGVKSSMAADLRERLASRSYRILKADVLDLPPKVYQDREVELTGAQRDIYQQMKKELRVAWENGSISAYNILEQLLRLTQITAGLVGEGDRYSLIPDHAKQVELDALMDELAGEQVVIFGVYQKELEALATRYVGSGYGSGIIYGPTPERVRHDYIEQFQAGDRRLLFCQVRTGGIGVNLTAARTAIYHTRSWSLEEYLQSQDRLHRIGQTGTVSIIHLVAKGTVDEQIAKALGQKQNLADHLTGDAAARLVREVLEGRKDA